VGVGQGDAAHSGPAGMADAQGALEAGHLVLVLGDGAQALGDLDAVALRRATPKES
jgi:hypothetical protein